MIHPTAIIHPNARIADDVVIGPWTLIDDEVEIASGSNISSHVVIKGPTKLGRNTRIFQFSSIGEEPQDLKFHGERSFLEVGDNNIFRESVTIHRGTKNGGGVTRIADNNLFMAYVHIAHDCQVGSGNVFANNASLSGHVIVEDYVTMGGFSAVHQFARLGRHCFVGGGAMVVKDVLPFLMVSGDPAQAYGLNQLGLQRRGFDNEVIAQLRKAYKIIFRKNLLLEEAVSELESLKKDCPEVEHFIRGIGLSQRGVAREASNRKSAESDE